MASSGGDQRAASVAADDGGPARNGAELGTTRTASRFHGPSGVSGGRRPSSGLEIGSNEVERSLGPSAKATSRSPDEDVPLRLAGALSRSSSRRRAVLRERRGTYSDDDRSPRRTSQRRRTKEMSSRGTVRVRAPEGRIAHGVCHKARSTIWQSHRLCTDASRRSKRTLSSKAPNSSINVDKICRRSSRATKASTRWRTRSDDPTQRWVSTREGL